MNDQAYDVGFCVECKRKENESSKLITCLYCFSNAHFSCRNIFGSAIKKLRKTMYFCTPKCSIAYNKIIDMQNIQAPMIEKLSSELQKSVTAVVSTQLKEVKTEVDMLIGTIENSQQFLSSKFDDIMNDFLSLKAENVQLKSEVEALKNELSSLKTFVYKLECSDDRSNRESLSKNAVLFGVPVQANENIPKFVTGVASRIGFELPADAIESASRIYAPESKVNELVPIRIVFKNPAVKESFFLKKKKFGKLSSFDIDRSLISKGKPTRIVIRDELSPLSLDLLREMRMLQNKMDLKYVWAGKDGAILVKTDENSKPVVIKNRNDMEKFVNRTELKSSLIPLPAPKCTNR